MTVLQNISRKPTWLGKVFLSAGIPEADAPDAPFHRHEIVEAVMAVTRNVLRHDGELVFGGHPLITPIIFEVAYSTLRHVEANGRVVLFQSRHFADSLPAQVWSFRDAPWASVYETEGDPPRDGESPTVVLKKRQTALDVMRRQMIDEFGPYRAAVMVGGKTGVADEYWRVAKQWESVPCYPIHHPGGAAGGLPVRNVTDGMLIERLSHSQAYSDIARRILQDVQSRP